MTEWKKYLKNLRNKHSLGAFEYNNSEMVELKIIKITEEFQSLFPGNYKLDWKIDTDTWTLELGPIFESDKDSNWWHLKYD